ncbi:UPF0175 family protein [Haloarcula amylolytica]|uniref:UPF0175 family protein n=1 Tax=Haloarcula amylolytica TaxID=396317 RepID=UPI003C71FC66
MTTGDAKSVGDNNRLATAIGLYALEEMTLGQAAEHADISKQKMKDILDEAGVKLRIGPKSKSEAISEIEALENWKNRCDF